MDMISLDKKQKLQRLFSNKAKSHYKLRHSFEIVQFRNSSTKLEINEK